MENLDFRCCLGGVCAAAAAKTEALQRDLSSPSFSFFLALCIGGAIRVLHVERLDVIGILAISIYFLFQKI
jgi:hypothetical protein